MNGEERLEQIDLRLRQGILPTEAEARWLVGQLKQDRDTIQLFTDAVLTMARDVTTRLGQRQQARRDLAFDDHAGQYVDG